MKKALFYRNYGMYRIPEMSGRYDATCQPRFQTSPGYPISKRGHYQKQRGRPLPLS